MSVFLAILLLAAEPAVAEREGAIAAIEKTSLEGGTESLGAILDFLGRWKGDKQMERHGVAALRRVSVPALDVAERVKSDPDPARRAWAAWLAGEQRLGATADALIAALKDEDATVRFRAAVSLGLVGDPRASDALLKAAVHDKDAQVRDAAEKSHAALASSRADVSPVEPVLARLELPDAFERLDAVREIEKRKERRAVGPLLELLKTERDAGVRRAVVTALAAIGDPLAVPALLESAKSDTSEVRAFAIGALATLDDDRAVLPIVELTKDPDERVRKFAVRAVAFLKRPGASGALVASLSDMVPDVRAEAAKGLTKLGAGNVSREDADRIAERVVLEPASGVRVLLIALLADVGSAGVEKHEKAVMAALEDENGEVRLVAAAALGKLGGPAAEKALRKLADKETRKKVEERDQELIKVATESANQAKGRTR